MLEGELCSDNSLLGESREDISANDYGDKSALSAGWLLLAAF